MFAWDLLPSLLANARLDQPIGRVLEYAKDMVGVLNLIDLRVHEVAIGYLAAIVHDSHRVGIVLPALAVGVFTASRGLQKEAFAALGVLAHVHHCLGTARRVTT